jgi:(heptosyl)LPS beta-1,4-glucosyltransferase
MPPISVVICCANSEDTLPAACQSVAWADELIIVDSGSKDRTAEIARQYAHRYVLEPWRGHSGQKMFASGLCTHDWIFFLDGDEECTPQLAQEWKAISDSEAEKFDLFLIPRQNYVMGRLVRAWWPDHLTRIFHRKRCSWDGHVLHDTRQASDPSRQRKFKGWIIHKRLSKAAFSDYFSGARMDERLLPVARQMYERGKRCHWWDLLIRPWLAFIKFYFIKRGFLDGVFGLLIAQKAALSAQLKYAALWAVQEEHKAGSKGK